MHTIPSAVSDQASVKGNYIRTLLKVTDEADVVLLVLDPHDDRGRGKLVEEPTLGLTLRPFSHPSRLHYSSTRQHPTLWSSEKTPNQPLECILKSIQARRTCLITKPVAQILLSAVQHSCNPRREDVMTTLELTLSSFAWLTASVAMRDIPSAVRGQTSVRSGKMKGHYIRTLDVVLLVLDAHDRAAAAASWSR
ncbi:hypothetical protein EDB83DRAFT_2529581 [Lactarius deliciosus]|nr:hypothetical protein EDB83DRAFT_2529581 [Lactarius deliciosus]